MVASLFGDFAVSLYRCCVVWWFRCLRWIHNGFMVPPWVHDGSLMDPWYRLEFTLDPCRIHLVPPSAPLVHDGSIMVPKLAVLVLRALHGNAPVYLGPFAWLSDVPSQSSLRSHYPTSSSLGCWCTVSGSAL